jgi:multidrug transporter EmrE-like cation transporter
MSFAFVLVMVASAIFFQEPLTGPKITGIVLICIGIIVGSQG